MKKIEFYFEFGSPYGYFAAHEMASLSEEFDVEIDWKPFMLGSACKETNAQPLMNIPLKGPYCVQDWERIALLKSVRWQLPSRFPAALLAPARGFYWLQSLGEIELSKTFALAAYQAYFADDRPMWDVCETAKVAQECGINPIEFEAAITSSEVKNLLIQKGEEAIKNGVFGSPFFKVDGESFWGWDRIWMLKHWLEVGKWTI